LIVNTFPEKISIFNVQYNIRYDKDDYLIANDISGEIFYDEQEIFIKNSLSYNCKIKVILHEVAHGILNEIGALMAKQDEKIIDIISVCMFHFLRENNVDWIRE
jgi:hypothetical protein